MQSSVNHDPTADIGSERRERGSALVLTLGVLALLLISATVFVFTAVTEREAAAINADVAKARLMAKAKMEQAMALIYHSSSTFYGTDGYHLPYPGTSLMGQGAGDWQNIWHRTSAWSTIYNTDFADAFHIDFGFDYTPTTTAGLAGNPSWQPTLDEDGKIIGRITYLIIDESGKLDPNSIINPSTEPFLDLNGNGSHDAGEPYFDWDGDGLFSVTPAPEGTEKRHGYITGEIDLSDGVLGANNLNVNPATTLASYFRDRRHPANTRWMTWKQMFDANYNPNSSGGSGALIDQASASLANDMRNLKNTLFPRSFDKEAFHDDGTDYQRFSVGIFDWSTADIGSLQGGATVWNGSVAATAIPWLANLTGDGTILDADLRNQVAANLIDYNDADSAATTDFVGPDYTAATIATGTYCGLERAPYINEVHIQVSEVENEDLTDPSNPVYTYDYDIQVDVELVNIYNTAFANGVLELHIQFGNMIGTAPSVGGGILAAGNNGIALEWTGVACAANAYTTENITFSYTDVTTAASFQITGVAAKLTVGVDLVDAAIVNPTSTVRSQAVASLVPGEFNFAVDDPRSNLHPEFWFYQAGGHSLGGRNTQLPGTTAQGDPSAASNYDANRDPETVGDVANPINGSPSTAFIRNGPMMSLWELGAIHRGEPWRTLNLRAFNDGKDVVTTPGTYANGDALLLDQCCVGPEKVAYGRLNVNSPVPTAWYGMLSKIFVGTGYGHGVVGTELTPAQIVAMLPGIIGATSGANAMPTRGRIAEIAALKSGSPAQTTTATQEEIIGKIANLLTTRQNYFRILVVAQAVADLGAVPASIPSANHSSSWREMAAGQWVDVLAEVKQMAIVRRDAHTNAIVVEHIDYLE